MYCSIIEQLTDEPQQLIYINYLNITKYQMSIKATILLLFSKHDKIPHKKVAY